MHRFIAIAAVLAATAPAVGAFAAPQRLLDVQFIEANRCLGLMSAKSTTTPDGAAMKAYVERQGWTRMPAVIDAGDQAREDAQSAASRASGYSREQLIAERDGVCRTFVAATTAAAAGNGGSSMQ